jgi:hypothetical protein
MAVAATTTTRRRGKAENLVAICGMPNDLPTRFLV